jgi:hypothetical protein
VLLAIVFLGPITDFSVAAPETLGGIVARANEVIE